MVVVGEQKGYHSLIMGIANKGSQRNATTTLFSIQFGMENSQRLQRWKLFYGNSPMVVLTQQPHSKELPFMFPRRKKL